VDLREIIAMIATERCLAFVEFEERCVRRRGSSAS
jgi:hypothetical protein